jgi:hypothetical protein
MPSIRSGGNESLRDVTITTGDITVDITPPTIATMDPVVFEQNTNASIAAGKRSVRIYNLGFVQSGDQENDIIVTLPSGTATISPKSDPFTIEAYVNQNSNIQYNTPAITITSNGSRFQVVILEA